MNKKAAASLVIALLVITALFIPLTGIAATPGVGAEEQNDVTEHGLGRRQVSPLEAELLRESTPLLPASKLKARLLPTSVNLSGDLPPVGDQGGQGSCVAWACAYYQKTHSEKSFEHTSWDLTNPWYQFSPSFVYNQIKYPEGGSLPQDAYPLLENQGCVDIAEFPYDDSDDSTQPTSAELEAAKPYKIDGSSYALWDHLGEYPTYSNPIEDAKTLLADGYTLTIGIGVYEAYGFPDYRSTGPAEYYDPGAGSRANHQVCICGYDDNINPGGSGVDHQGGFLMVNSWSSDWNGDMNGYLWISYDWMRRFVEDCWVLYDVEPDSPSISSLSTDFANVGEKVTIKGNNFGTRRRSARVSFNGTSASSATFTNSSITATVPYGATSGPLTVYDWEGTASNQFDFTVGDVLPAPNISYVYPSSGKIGTTVTINGYYFDDTRGSSTVRFGDTVCSSSDYVSWANDRIDVKVPSGAQGDVQVKVSTETGTSNSKSFSVTAPAPPEPEKQTTWYLAEGSTSWEFATYISIENPNDSAVTVKVTYMTPEGQVAGEEGTIPAMSQTTLNPAEILGSKDFSTLVECVDGKTIAVDRTMMWTGGTSTAGSGGAEEGHNSIGVTSPSDTWYLPEGSSKWGFETWLLVQNPNSVEANCNITYMMEGEEPVTINKKVPANSRRSFNMEDDIGNKDASIKVASDVPVISERAMYRNNRREGHSSIGTTTPARDYFLAEGTTAWGFTTYVLIQNPNSADAEVTLTYMTPSGAHPQAPFNLPANSRRTIRVNDALPGTDFSTQVTGSLPLIAERAMYWNSDTGEACHDSIGMDSPHTSFYLPDGDTSNGRETWTLVQNPNDSTVTVEISYLTPYGSGNPVFQDSISANSRKTYSMADAGISGRAAVLVTSKTAGMKIMVERSMYWNNRGAGTDTIGGYSD